MEFSCKQLCSPRDVLEHHPYYVAFIAQPTILAERAVPKAFAIAP
jgi:hypothetical protein